MRKLGIPATRVAAPVKTWAPRFLFVVLVILSLTLMVLDRYDTRLIQQARIAVIDGVTPLLDLMTRPVDTVAGWMEAADELANLRGENARLKLDNSRLLKWQEAARRLEAENAALRGLLRLAPDPAQSFVTARAVGDPGGAYVRSLLVNAGSDAGVAEGQAAVTGDGLVGRVLQVGRRSARVLLITDINSRIPVVVGEARSRAILGGDNTSLPRLLYLDPKTEVQQGDRIETSGHGGALPPGIPVGVVALAADDNVRVAPFVDWGRADYLRLVGYGLSTELRGHQGAPAGGPGR